jgi:hypothetical protein
VNIEIFTFQLKNSSLKNKIKTRSEQLERYVDAAPNVKKEDSLHLCVSTILVYENLNAKNTRKQNQKVIHPAANFHKHLLFNKPNKFSIRKTNIFMRVYHMVVQIKNFIAKPDFHFLKWLELTALQVVKPKALINL